MNGIERGMRVELTYPDRNNPRFCKRYFGKIANVVDNPKNGKPYITLELFDKRDGAFKNFTIAKIGVIGRDYEHSRSI